MAVEAGTNGIRSPFGEALAASLRGFAARAASALAERARYALPVEEHEADIAYYDRLLYGADGEPDGAGESATPEYDEPAGAGDTATPEPGREPADAAVERAAVERGRRRGGRGGRKHRRAE